MAEKAVFLDRDNTLIEDPGYLSDPGAVKLLPGVELALKGLAQAGYKLVVVTNQSGIARGLLTVEALQAIHEELRRQLADDGAQLDAIYYCPYHPEGSVDAYTRTSEERKPKPGMLLRAAKEMDLDLEESWMVGDSPHDVEAGDRAGCRTVRVRAHVGVGHGPAAQADEDVRADFTVRNLVDAARVIVRESAGTPPESPHLPAAPTTSPSTGEPLPTGEERERGGSAVADMSDSEVLRELLQHARQFVRMQGRNEFSATKLIAGVSQGLAALAFLGGLVKFISLGSPTGEWSGLLSAIAWLGIAGVLQLTALAFFLMAREE